MAQIKGAGNLRERFAAESRQEIDDGAGNTVSGPWVEQCIFSAAIDARRGGEAVIAGRLQGTVNFIVTGRYTSALAAVNTDWRLRDTRTGAIFAIRTVVPRPGRDYIDFDAVSGVADG